MLRNFIRKMIIDMKIEKVSKDVRSYLEIAENENSESIRWQAAMNLALEAIDRERKLISEYESL